MIESVDFKGPVFDTWPPASHKRILFPSSLPRNGKAYARAVIQRFMRRAYRRPVRKAEVDEIAALYDKIRPQTDSLEAAMRETLATVLVLPDFLYLLEQDSCRCVECTAWRAQGLRNQRVEAPSAGA